MRSRTRSIRCCSPASLVGFPVERKMHQLEAFWSGQGVGRGAGGIRIYRRRVFAGRIWCKLSGRVQNRLVGSLEGFVGKSY